MENEVREQWHLDKRVPISLIVTILIQTGAVVWFMSGLSGRVDANTQAIARIATSADDQDERVRANTTSVAVIQRSLENTEQTLDRIDRRLENIAKALGEP